MHIRYSTRTRNGQKLRYAQIVQSYRRPKDGMPAVRVIAHLGLLPEATVEALRTALRAARAGEGLVLESVLAEAIAGSTLANLSYLDLAVLRDCWMQWELGQLLEQLAGPSMADITFSDMVLALVLQRCVDPGSKLEATRWVRTTALPELLGFAPQSFENTRIHRVLDTLHAIDDRLQVQLAKTCLRHEREFKVLFMDVTDTHFEGIGPPTAEVTRTKTEMPNKRCLGIVLLVNEQGYPLRWKVVGGKTKDWTAMGDLVRAMRGVPWLPRTPIVFDRAMGNRSTVRELKAADLFFLTAAHRDSIESYSSALPTSAFADIKLEGTNASYEADIKRVAAAARCHPDFTEIHEHLFAVDLGVRELEAEKADATTPTVTRQLGGAHLLVQAQSIRERMLASDPPLTQASVASVLGLSVGRVGQLLSMLRLSPEVQKCVHDWGQRLPLRETQLRSLLKLSVDDQLPALQAMLSVKGGDDAESAPDTDRPQQAVGPLRMVAYFNPQLFVDLRRRTAGHCAEIQRRVDELNAELAKTKRSRNRDATYRKFAHEIERLHYLDSFDVALVPITVESAKKAKLTSYRGSITRKDDPWNRRRKHDGFVLLLAHPEIKQSGVELVQLYRAKDKIEKDFQTIKSVCKLRPIFHHTDPKVIAHVTLCVLSLLLQRTLEERLRAAQHPMSATACVEALRTCHLNLRRPADAKAVYDITVPTPQQQAILASLGLQTLTSEEKQRHTITPRDATE